MRKNLICSLLTTTVLLAFLVSCDGRGVIFSPRGVPVTHVVLEETSIVVSLPERPRVLIAYVMPENATNRAVRWTSSNPEVASVVGGTYYVTVWGEREVHAGAEITFRNVGRTTITATTMDGNRTARSSVEVVPQGCATHLPDWGNTLGKVGFVSDRTWIVGNQLWSDAVTAEACNKTDFHGGRGIADCYRSRKDYRGVEMVADLFSWCAVVRFSDQLCPYPWHVPTVDDFIDLDIALGGTGESYPSVALFNRYLNDWGATYFGIRTAWGVRPRAHYWSQTVSCATNAYSFLLSPQSGWIVPYNRVLVEHKVSRCFGLALRCVQYLESQMSQIVAGCSSNTPGWGNNLGRVSFATNQTWRIGNQTWSDAVTATACQKTAFNGGVLDVDNPANSNFNADCRSNPDFSGDLFSWCAVVRFADQLCPYPWRVPAVQDFIDLDIAFGEKGENRDKISFDWINRNYINSWGGIFGGGCASNGMLEVQGSRGMYWSLSETNVNNGHRLNFDTDGYVLPQGWQPKNLGATLRCIRDAE